VPIRFVGATAFRAGLAELKLRLGVGAGTGLKKATEKIAQDAADSIRARTHATGTQTPSRPGEPPANISGHLADSIRAQPVRVTGFGHYESGVGADAAYARIQELGGETGRAHTTTLPPRPFIQPAIDRYAVTVSDEVADAITNALNA
jgi:HK97 gp10 family phage protein